MGDRTFYTDENGIWCEHRPDVRSGIQWDEIAAVSGHKLDGITEIYTCVVLDFEYGEYIELCADWPGFDGVVAELTRRLAGLPDDWYKQITALAPHEPPIVVWTRMA